MKTHAIHWKSIVTGTIGTGTKRFEKDEAERLATELNENYPEIIHEAVIPVPVPAAASAPQDLTAEEQAIVQELQRQAGVVPGATSPAPVQSAQPVMPQ